MSEVPDPIVAAIPWLLKGCTPILVEISEGGRIFVDGDLVEPAEETRRLFQLRQAGNAL